MHACLLCCISNSVEVVSSELGVWPEKRGGSVCNWPHREYRHMILASSKVKWRIELACVTITIAVIVVTDQEDNKDAE